MSLVRALAKNMLISRGKKTKKTKQMNKIIEKKKGESKLLCTV